MRLTQLKLKRFIGLVAIFATALSVVATFGDGMPPPTWPGVLGGGVTLLPNGWKIAPAGRHMQIGDLPLAMVESPDGRALLVADNGYAKPTVVVVDLEHEYVRGSVTLDHAWLGLVWHPDGKRLYVSGAGNTTVHEMQFADGKLTPGTDLVLGRQMEKPTAGTNRPDPVPQSFIGGLAVSPDGSRLFAAHILGQIVSAVDLKSGHVLKSIELPAEPYTSVVSPDGSTLFVSLWGGAKVLLFDARTLEPRGDVAVGEHPNAMAISRDGKRLFVACANTNAVWAIDVDGRRAVEQISIALFPNAPPGSTPNHVSLSPDEKRLLVANADNNAVAVVDISKPGASQVEGFIPTGWYPTAAMFSHDGSRIFVLSGKGLTSQANPRFRRKDVSGGDAQYIGAMLTGTLSILPTPDRAALSALTKTVYNVTPYSDEHRLAPAGAPAGSPIPRRVGDPSPIKHVFYVIRENRSYDQIFGDLDRGNGDPTLCLFGDQVTPNAHALVREFGVLDNFYVDAEVSYDGHAFSTGSYATDVIEKFWPTNYAARGAVYLSEGRGAARNGFGNLSAPLNGYVWDACVRKGVSVRSFGEFAHWEDGNARDHASGKMKVAASVPGLEGRVSPDYPAWDLNIPDQRRADIWQKELRELEAQDKIPALSIIRLGGDHTFGTSPGMWTPRAMVADNDLALGRIVEAISQSKVWKESAIFVLEDDAQNGPDHVDAHRSPGLVISPFCKRRSVDSTLYTTSAMLRTIELILGLPPMSQYDAAATPMYSAFQATPVLTPFTHLSARISLDEKNDASAWGAEASMAMDLSDADRVPEQLFNEIIWRSVKGAASPMPPPVRSAWVRPSSGAAAGDDDDR
jgi:YVTN family beta-propeller protein